VKRDPCLDRLSRDHHQALTIALRLTRATADTVEQTRRELHEFWRDQGRLHFRVEEEVLLPAFAAYGDAYHPLIATTLCDHVAIRHRVDVLLSGPKPAPSALHGLGIRLREHVRMEERKLFPLIERSVPSAALVALAVALQQAEREAL
jgi:hypothetical protein